MEKLSSIEYFDFHKNLFRQKKLIGSDEILYQKMSNDLRIIYECMHFCRTTRSFQDTGEKQRDTIQKKELVRKW